MKKKFLYSALFLMGMAFTGFTAASCNDDEDGGNGGNEFDEAANLNYTPENAASWRNYSLQVAKLLQKDATTLYDSWETSFQGGDAFKKTFTEHNGGDYKSSTSAGKSRTKWATPKSATPTTNGRPDSIPKPSTP